VLVIVLYEVVANILAAVVFIKQRGWTVAVGIGLVRIEAIFRIHQCCKSQDESYKTPVGSCVSYTTSFT
jgi:hypothetical protein